MNLRGLLYTLPGTPAESHAIPANGSLCIVVLAFLLPLVRRSPRLFGHLAAAIVLMQLAWGTTSPVFRVLYDYSLLPGLHYFRNTTLYLVQWTVGVAIIAAASADGLAVWARQVSPRLTTLFGKPRIWAAISLGLAGWIAVLTWVRTPGAPAVQFAIVIAAGIGFVALARARKPNWIAPLITGLFLLECVALRLHPFHVASNLVVSLQDPFWQ